MAIDAAVLEGQFWYRPKSEPKLIVHVISICLITIAAHMWSTAFSRIYPAPSKLASVVQKDSFRKRQVPREENEYATDKPSNRTISTNRDGRVNRHLITVPPDRRRLFSDETIT